MQATLTRESLRLSPGSATLTPPSGWVVSSARNWTALCPACGTQISGRGASWRCESDDPSVRRCPICHEELSCEHGLFTDGVANSFSTLSAQRVAQAVQQRYNELAAQKIAQPAADDDPCAETLFSLEATELGYRSLLKSLIQREATIQDRSRWRQLALRGESTLRRRERTEACRGRDLVMQEGQRRADEVFATELNKRRIQAGSEAQSERQAYERNIAELSARTQQAFEQSAPRPFPRKEPLAPKKPEPPTYERTGVLGRRGAHERNAELEARYLKASATYPELLKAYQAQEEQYQQEKHDWDQVEFAASCAHAAALATHFEQQRSALRQAYEAKLSVLQDAGASELEADRQAYLKDLETRLHRAIEQRMAEFPRDTQARCAIARDQVLLAIINTDISLLWERCARLHLRASALRDALAYPVEQNDLTQDATARMFDTKDEKTLSRFAKTLGVAPTKHLHQLLDGLLEQNRSVLDGLDQLEQTLGGLGERACSALAAHPELIAQPTGSAPDDIQEPARSRAARELEAARCILDQSELGSLIDAHYRAL